MTSRNDNYGGDSLLRMQRSIDSIVFGAETAKLFVELVIVEWNPPKENPPLKEVINFPKDTNFVSFRIITVPSAVHASFNTGLPLIEYAAKNAGIRRAGGEFVLCTNPDNYFPLSFFQALVKEPMDTQSFYRADRYDVIPPDSIFDTLPVFVKEYILKKTIIFAKVLQGYFPVQSGRVSPASYEGNNEISHLLEDNIFFGPSGDFLLASRAAWFTIGGYKESSQNQIAIDNIGLLQMLTLGLKQKVFVSPVCTWHFDHSRPLRQANKLWLSYIMDVLRGKDINLINDSGWGLEGIQLDEYQTGAVNLNDSVNKTDAIFPNKIDSAFIPSLIRWKKIIRNDCSKLWQMMNMLKKIIKYCLPYGFIKAIGKC
jgi:hypothetical protein